MDTSDEQRARNIETTSTTVTHNTEKNEGYLDVNTTTTDTRQNDSTAEALDSDSENVVDKRPPPNFWSAVGSVDVGDSTFGMPQEHTQEEKKAESVQMVLKLIEQVNENKTEFASSDSKALKKVQTELQKICRLVTGFLEYSSNLVNDEGASYVIKRI